jgi:predicted Fe-S protein YdhL (DUF1289 family)
VTLPAETMSVIASPCLKICVMEPGSKLCRGCGRTIEEITGWSMFSDGERHRIMAALPARLSAAGLSPNSGAA